MWNYLLADLGGHALRLLQAMVVDSTPPPVPKGHEYQFAFLLVMYFMSHFDMLIPPTSSVQNVRKRADSEIRENRKAKGKERVNRIKSPSIVCLEIRHKTKTRKSSKIFRVSQSLIRSENFFNSWLQTRFTTNTAQLSTPPCISICNFVDIALSYLLEGSTTFLDKLTKYSTLQYCTLKRFQYWKENMIFDTTVPNI